MIMEIHIAWAAFSCLLSFATGFLVVFFLSMKTVERLTAKVKEAEKLLEFTVCKYVITPKEKE